MEIALRHSLKSGSFRFFHWLDAIGLHILPKHYYTPVPDYGWLKKNRAAWMKRAPLVGLEWNLDGQIEWLKQCCRAYYGEVSGLNLYREFTTTRLGPGFGPIESQILHCFIRQFSPSNIIEIGSGVSTACILEATRRNEQEKKAAQRITCVEPFPSVFLKEQKNIRLIQKTCQEVDISEFESLREGDFLFIDSSHTVKVGSDVVRIYTEIIPKLRAGVTIHIHDIYLPYLYPRNVLENYFGWQETVLVLALLTNNPKIEILSCLSALHYDRATDLKSVLPDYNPQPGQEGLSSGPEKGFFPSSLWLRTR